VTVRVPRTRCARGLVAIAAAALFAAGCGSDDEEGATAAKNGADGAEGKKVVMIAPFANPFQTSVRRGAEAVAADNGVEMTYLNFNANSQLETQHVNDAITQDPDLVIYGANDAKVSLAGFRRISDAGIPIVCFDTCIEPAEQPKYTEAFVTSDNAQLGDLSGTAAAEYIESELGGSATIAFITCNTQSACRDRFATQTEALGAIEYEEVANQVAVESDKVKQTAEGIVQANPDLDMIVTNGLPQTEGAAAAVTNLGSDAVVFGMDMTSSVAQALLEEGGPLQATVGQDGTEIGTISMQLAVDILNGKPPTEFDHLVPGTPYSRSDPAAVEEFLATVEE
jgi:sugar transport system substrate-binding protein